MNITLIGLWINILLSIQCRVLRFVEELQLVIDRLVARYGEADG